jgi:hypothetical protein
VRARKSVRIAARADASSVRIAARADASSVRIAAVRMPVFVVSVGGAPA